MTGQIIGCFLALIIHVIQAKHEDKYYCSGSDEWNAGHPQRNNTSSPSLAHIHLGQGGLYKFDITGGWKDNQKESQRCEISVTVLGENGTSSKLDFSIEEHSSDSQAENVHTLYLKGVNLGHMKSLGIQLSVSEMCMWYPRNAEVTSINSNHNVKLPCGSKSRALNRKRRNVDRYMIVGVQTYDQNWAGTDADVYIYIHGKKSSTGKMWLSGSFEVDDWDTTSVHVGDLGIINAITFGHNDKGSSSGYKLDYVRIEEPGEGYYYFRCACWLEDDVLSRRIGIENECSEISHCASQRCVTCDACDGSDGTYFHALKSDKSYCFRCTHISNCDVEECPSDDGQVCSRCTGVVSESPGFRAYVAAPDRRSCIQACSWRSDSTRCYPGACANEYASNCACSAGFSGRHCDTITDKPVILWNYLLYTRDPTNTAEAPLDPNIVTNQEKSWTNLKDIQTVDIDFKSKFIQSGTVPPRPAYVEDYKVGIIQGTIKYRFFRGGTEETGRSRTIQCGGASSSGPNQSIYKCLKQYNIPDFAPTPLTTGDTLHFEFVTKNGGYIKARNKETNSLDTFFYTGSTASVTVKMGIDYVNPYHCSESTACVESMMTVVDTSLQATVNVAWDGWRDDMAGIHHYLITVFDMEYIASVMGLQNKGLILTQEYTSDTNQGNITLTATGIHSVELSTYDKAGNYRNSRRIMIYDEESAVTTVHNTVLRVTSAAELSAWEWQWTIDSVTVDWTNRYINVLHHDKKWLERAVAVSDIDSSYDDNDYSRGIAAIPNVQAVVEYQTAFLIDHAGGNSITTVPDESEFSSRGLDQSHTITPALVDGDTLRYWIRAYDIRRQYLEESVTVHFDTSHPIIENLWLTRGDRLNVSVHRIEELSTMTIEWESYDDHSGLETVSWRLFDNITGSDIVHGIQHLTAQGDAPDEAACNAKYDSYPRGSNCYCTPGNGCYHRHYQVKPVIVADHQNHGGVFQSKDRGVHDVDYFLEVTVMNHAHLTTVLDFKVTVDASPPHPGVVHDGQAGKPEVDYQSSLQIHAHWEGFFDKESGVMFYQYGFDDRCLKQSDFALDLSTVQITETYSTHASWIAPATGKFFITVVAYNRALEPSSPVCSDGVTVDQTKPVLSEIAVLNSHTTEGLVKTESGEVWFISADRRRSKVEDPDAICTQKATLVPSTDLSLLPIHVLQNGSDVTHVAAICADKMGFSLPGVNTFYLSKDNFVYINWTSTDTESGIHDFEVALMSNPSHAEAPDILYYASTYHHPHYQGYHSGVSEGEQFYIAIKAINRAGLMAVEILGPVTVHTLPPSFTGTINVAVQSSFLVASWTSSAFTDPEQNYLQYHFAVGSSPGGTEILPFRPIQTGNGCSAFTPPSCTAVNVTHLHWDLHHSHTYYMAIKVINIVGLFTVGVSNPYRHDVRVPSPGVVLDLSPPSERQLFDITEFEDSDFQLSTTTLYARWYGFDDGLSGVTYKACIGTDLGLQDVRAYEDVGGALEHHFQGLNLQVNQKYYLTVTSMNDAEETTSTSDGVTVIENNVDLVGISVKDGETCESIPGCIDDIKYQTSVTTYSSHWTTSDQQQQQFPDAHIQLERKVPNSENFWTVDRDFENHGLIQHAVMGNLSLKPGHTYRAAVKFCAVNVCTNPVYSDGVTVIPHPPLSGGIQVTYSEIGEQSQVTVLVDQYVDPDIPVKSESFDVMDRYEWSLTDNSHNANMLIHWTPVSSPSINGEKVTFVISLPKHLTFNKCHRVAVRGFNKLGIYTIVSTDIKDCKAFDPLLIKPTTVIDAIGSKSEYPDEGNAIFLDKNARWPFLDADYTPYKNILSAVWPSLRHHNYSWAVVKGDSVDPVSHYKKESLMTVTDPCDLPEVVKCGMTDKEYVNVNLEDSENLQHGKRYYICIHADEKSVVYEKWPTVLTEVNSCSDGITVDLTPPSPGTVIVNGLKGGKYQVSRSDVSVSWDGFTDVEESGPTPHPRGISHYKLALGSVPYGEDIFYTKDVGLVNHRTIAQLSLHDGQIVFATVTASDFVNKTQQVTSAGFVIDSSPPETSDRQIQFEDRYVTSSVISICWDGVLYDPHSGIQYYDVSFGSRPGQADIVPLTRVLDICSQFDTASKLMDGHSFYISVKAFNRAGLSTMATSHALTVDTTLPTVGHVYDGKLTAAVDDAKDKDFVTNIIDMGAHWEGFYDPHSPIKHFKVKVGTCVGCDDTVAEYEAAARTDVVFVDRHTLFVEGTKYYVTVTACNKAGLCSSATSDGVILDQTPPVSGRVMDGTQDRDIQYQASRTFLGCKWHGFQDPESGLDYYEWSAGTTPGGDDILPPSNTALREVVFHTFSAGNLLPVGQKIYITVTAYNKAGLSTNATSNGFIVDDTVPEIVKSAVIESGQGSLVNLTLMSRTTMRISWELKDEESFIEKQYISISSHQLGEFDSSALELPELLREFTYTQLDLHDGSQYKIRVTACNMAGMCTTVDTGDILMDGSIPVTGTLAVHTDHAARLSRHQSNGMTWTGNSLNLAWLGFADLHSGINHYIVTVGSSPFGTDLAKDELPNIHSHDTAGVDKEDEGVVQIFTVDTTDISSLASLFVAIWAVNGVGLRSSPLHAELVLGEGGQLELVRRCTPYNCEGHCVCAVQDKKCAVSSGCTVLDNGGSNAIVTVNDVISLSPLDPDVAADVDFSPSDTFLAAAWTTTTNQSLQPVRYEFSAGLTQFNTPKGIYNTDTDRVWFDAGTQRLAVITLERGTGRELTPGLKYSVFVRAWYGNNTYSIFKSDGVVIDTTRPSFTDKIGLAVKEHKTDLGGKDVDFQDFTDTMHISWDGKFLPGHSGLLKYRVYVSTSPGGHSIHGSGDIATTTYTVTGLALEPATLYFSSTLAYNKAGLVGWTYSDGVQPDMVRPVRGTVQDGDELHDTDYQSSPTDISASWFGFSDTDSTIVKYFWCVGTSSDTEDCSLMNWRDVGLHTSARTRLTVPQSDGTKLWVKVYAVDTVGHTSEISVSDGVTIDSSFPEIKETIFLGDNLVSNPSFEDDGSTGVSTSVSCNHLIPSSWTAGGDSCIKVVTPDAPNAKHGDSHLSLSGSINQTVTRLVEGRTYLITLHAGYPETLTVNHKAVEGSVSIGREVFTFSLDPRMCKGVCQVNEQSSILWTTLKYNFVGETESADLIIATSSRDMEVTIDSVAVQTVDKSGNLSSMDSQQHLTVHPVFLPHWSAVHVSWHFTDDHSPITEYSWAAGTVRGGSQIQNFVSVGRHSQGTLTALKLTHRQYLELTITARNAAGLTRVLHSPQIIVDMTPPVFSLIIDGRDSDIDYQEIGDVQVTWSVDDFESGVHHCDWGIGVVPGGSDIKKFEKVPAGETTALFDFTHILTSPSLKVFSTVRCFNLVGHMATATTDGVTVVRGDIPPTVEGLEVLKDEVPYLYGKGNCQSYRNVRLQWARNNLQSAVVGVTDDTDSYQMVVPSDFEFTTMSGLRVNNLSTYHMEVFPSSITGTTGDVTPLSFTSHGKPPAIKDSTSVQVIRDGDHISLSWLGLFDSPWKDLLYEVHVGTVLGGADVLERVITRDNTIQLTLTSATTKKTAAFLSVTAVDPCGYTTPYNYKFDINVNKK